MIAIIAAMTKNRVIGKDNALPWHISDDLKNFKKLTSGNTVIMGRKTWDSLPDKYKPLPNRHNIVVSRSMNDTDGIDVCSSVDDALAKAASYGKETFIIGGGTLYSAMIEKVDTMFLSYVKQDVEGDAFFPEFDETQWDVVKRTDFAEFELVEYRRKH